MAKGGQWEREFSVFLSEWAVPGRSDLFWRSQNSGARATVRARKGLKTAGQASDIAATDPLGLPFTQLITLELKNGYTGTSNAADFLDRNLKKKTAAKLTLMEIWYWQVKAAQKNEGNPYWMIVARRNQRNAVVLFPDKLRRALMGPPHCLLLDKSLPRPTMTIRALIRKNVEEPPTRTADIFCMRMEDFFRIVPFSAIKYLHKRHKRGKD